MRHSLTDNAMHTAMTIASSSSDQPKFPYFWEMKTDVAFLQTEGIN